jgi:hypothetical protein
MSPDYFYYFIILLCGTILFLIIKNIKLTQDIENLNLKIKGLQLASDLYRATNSKVLENQPKISKRTEGLISLALRNNNEHESASAALQVCRNISKELGIK